MAREAEAGYQPRMNLDVTGLLVFGLLIGVPAVVMTWMSPRWRAGCFLLALLLMAGTLALADGPHDSILLLFLAGGGIALAAVLVEVPAFAIRAMRRRRTGAGGEADGWRPPGLWRKRR